MSSLIVLAVLLFVWTVANIAGFLITKNSHQSPINWRILLGPFVYLKWAPNAPWNKGY